MSHSPLDVWNCLASWAFVPAPVESFGCEAELDTEVVRIVLRLDFATLFLPQPDERCFIIAHDDSGVRSSDKTAPFGRIEYPYDLCVHFNSSRLRNMMRALSIIISDICSSCQQKLFTTWS